MAVCNDDDGDDDDDDDDEDEGYMDHESSLCRCKECVVTGDWRIMF